MLFELANLGANLHKPLTKKILSDPQHKITRHLLYLYTMESFIYENLNTASREKDKSKIKYYGAYAAALSYILHAANQNRSEGKLKRNTILYRGLRMTPSQVAKYQKGQKIRLRGYTSTSTSIEVALNFATQSIKPDQVPVIFEITFQSQQGLFFMTKEYTAFEDECEVLVQDGLEYAVTDCECVPMNQQQSNEAQ